MSPVGGVADVIRQDADIGEPEVNQAPAEEAAAEEPDLAAVE